MGLVQIKEKNFHNLTHIALNGEFKVVFDNKLGELPGVTILHLKYVIIHVVIPNRRVLVSLRPQL